MSRIDTLTDAELDALDKLLEAAQTSVDEAHALCPPDQPRIDELLAGTKHLLQAMLAHLSPRT